MNAQNIDDEPQTKGFLSIGAFGKKERKEKKLCARVAQRAT